MAIFILGIAFVIMSMYILFVYVYIPRKYTIPIEGTIIDYEVIELDEGLTYTARIVYEDPYSHETKETMSNYALPFEIKTPQRTTLRYQKRLKNADILEEDSPYILTSLALLVVGVIMILLYTGGYL